MSSKLQIKFRKHSGGTPLRAGWAGWPTPAETAPELASPAPKSYIYGKQRTAGRARLAKERVMRELKQHKGFDKREFRFTDSKLYYAQCRLGECNEIDIPFENIDGERVSYHTSRTLFLGVSVTLLLLAIAALIIWAGRGGNGWVFALIPALGSAAFLWLYRTSRKDFWKIKLKTEDYLYLYKNIPAPEQTQAFLKSLLEARNAYLRENYLRIDENLDYEQQFYNLRWLRSIDAIDKDEFETKYEELKQTVKPEKRAIGFSK